MDSSFANKIRAEIKSFQEKLDSSANKISAKIKALEEDLDYLKFKK